MIRLMISSLAFTTLIIAGSAAADNHGKKGGTDKPAAAAKAPAAAAKAPAAAAAKAPEKGAEKPADKAGPPAPSKALDVYAAIAGNWGCDGKTHDNPMGPSHPIKSKINIKKELNGFWYVLKYDEKKTKQNPMPYAILSLRGADPTGKLTRSDTDNFGGIAHYTSAGLQDNKMVWEGSAQMGPNKVPVRETISVTGKKTFDAMIEAQGPDGKWGPFVEMKCKR